MYFYIANVALINENTVVFALLERVLTLVLGFLTIRNSATHFFQGFFLFYENYISIYDASRSQRGSACAEAHCCREPTRQKNCARGSGRTSLSGRHRGWTGMEFLKRILMRKKKLESSASCHSHSHLPAGFLHFRIFYHTTAEQLWCGVKCFLCPVQIPRCCN
jgi:hypothetical protein